MENDTIPFGELTRIVDRILEDCDEDVICTRMRLSSLDPAIRNILFTSDLLNAWQVFFYFFQAYPDDQALEILAFNPASVLPEGLLLGEYRECMLTFYILENQPVIVVSDDIQEWKRFFGPEGYAAALTYLETDE